MKYFAQSIGLAAWLLAMPAAAHHGVAGLGAAGLTGPGAPVESSSSATLPAGSGLLYLKLDHAQYRHFGGAAPEADYAQFSMAGAGYGFTPWFSAYLFQPYHAKVDTPGGFSTHGFADASLMGVIGMKYDNGLQLTPANESLDDLEDWHFTLYGGVTLPTGNPNMRDPAGAIDPGKSTGFGKSSYTLGATASKMVSERTTLNLDISHQGFQEYAYADGNRARFGAERRVNFAVNHRLWADGERKLRLDGVLETQFLAIGRDETNGVAEAATGGRMLYLMPGLRLYLDRWSLAAGVKKAVWTQLNEEAQQQGAEGRESYRLVFSVSRLF